jgi:hypothetical protein
MKQKLIGVNSRSPKGGNPEGFIIKVAQSRQDSTLTPTLTLYGQLLPDLYHLPNSQLSGGRSLVPTR